MNKEKEYQISSEIYVCEASKNSREKIPSIYYPESKCHKHQITPLKARSKTSKRNDKDDVHSSCFVTPVNSPSKMSVSHAISPYTSAMSNADYLDMCSQDLPDIGWDYSSPERTGQKENDRDVVIDDLLRNLKTRNFEFQDVVTENSSHLKYLDKWMSIKGVSPISDYGEKKFFKKPKSKRPPRLLIEEMQSVLDSILKTRSSNNDESSCERKNEDTETFLNVNNQKSLEISDFIDDWNNKGDNFGPAKPISESESCLLNSQKYCVDEYSGEMCCSSSISGITDQCKSISVTENIQNNSLNSKSITEDTIFKTSLCSSEKKKILNCTTKINQNYQKQIGDDMWENEFDDLWADGLDAEILSQIPDEVFMGKANTDAIVNPQDSSENTNACIQTALKTNSLVHVTNTCANKCPVFNQASLSDCIIKEEIKCAENDFEEVNDPFDDAFPINELLTWLDKAESQFSSKYYTPEEIAQKRENALKKLKQKKEIKKNSILF